MYGTWLVGNILLRYFHFFFIRAFADSITHLTYNKNESSFDSNNNTLDRENKIPNDSDL